MTDRIEDLTEHLVKNNIKPSFQRIKILEYLVKNNTHPTVDEIYKEVVLEIPTLSKTTVYNTLNLFIEANILKGLYIEGNEVRYDAILSDHGHFKCNRCEKIYDFEINIDQFYTNTLNGFEIREKGVYFKGICPKCILEIQS